MAIAVKELIKKLEEDDQEMLVEFIIVNTDGGIGHLDVSESAKDMYDLLVLFNLRDSK